MTIEGFINSIKMADETNEDDSWLYGISTAENDGTNDNDNSGSNGLESELEISKEEADNETDGQLVRMRFHTKTSPWCAWSP